MTEVDAAYPEGVLIDELRDAHRPRLSVRKAAEQAGISEGRWRQIVKGYQQVTSDVRAPVRAPADTLARMAKVVGATPEQLRNANREDAAEELQALTQAPAATDEQILGSVGVGIRNLGAATLAMVDAFQATEMVTAAESKRLRGAAARFERSDEILGDRLSNPEIHLLSLIHI